MGSADWMPRNLDKRVEILFPVEDDALKAEVIHILDIQLADNEKARILQKNGTYRRAAKGGHAKLNSQKYFCEEAKRAQKERKKQNKNTHTFEPLHSVRKSKIKSNNVNKRRCLMHRPFFTKTIMNIMRYDT